MTGGVYNSEFWKEFSVSSRDPLEVELFEEVKKALPKTKAVTTWDSSYKSNIRRYQKWCAERIPPRKAVPAEVSTVVLYLQYVVRSARSYAVVKSASGAIFTLHQCALVPVERIPTKDTAAKMVREAAKRTIGLKLIN